MAPGELFADYLPRTEQHWLRCAGRRVGPGAREEGAEGRAGLGPGLAVQPRPEDGPREARFPAA